MVNYKKIIEMFGAQTYGTLVNTADKIFTVPLFMYFWGVHLYGEWLILRSFPSYIAIAELGFATSAANKMSEAVENEDFESASVYYKTAFMMIVLLSVAIMLISVSFYFVYDLLELFNFQSPSTYNLPVVFFLLILYAILIFQTQLLSAAYRAVGLYVRAAVITYNIRLAELVLLVIALFIGGGLVEASMAYAIARICGVLYMTIELRVKISWLHNSNSRFKWSALKEMTPSAFGFFAMPVGQAISLQGILMVISTVYSPAVVAMFSVARTLSRTLVQIGMQVNRSVWPELTRLSAIGAKDQSKKLFCNFTASTFWVSILTAICMVLSGHWIIDLWTLGKISVNQWLFFILVLSALLNGYWYSCFALLSAVEKHVATAWLYVLINVFSIFSAYYLSVFFDNIIFVAYSVLLVDFIMLILVVNKNMRILSIDFVDFLIISLIYPCKLFNWFRKIF